MNFLAISGSARASSTNTAMLRALRDAAGPTHALSVYDRIGELPIFSPDLELPEPPQAVVRLASEISRADALIFSSPEYVRSIPGGIKNAIDWLVSRDELIGKPVALAHASHRGDDMLHQLRIVLSTVSDRFTDRIFLRFHLMSLSPDAVARELSQERCQNEMREFLDALAAFCQAP